MKSKTIVFANQKGGVAKSTTASTVASFLTRQNQKVLLIDLDQQSNLTFMCGINPFSVKQNLYQVSNLDSLIVSTSFGDIIPANSLLFVAEPGNVNYLKKALQGMVSKYDYILIDTSPSLSIHTLQALTAADFVLVPAQASILSAQGLNQLFDSIKSIQQKTNHDLKVLGVILTRFKPRTNVSKDLEALIQSYLSKSDISIFPTKIRDCTALEEAAISQKSIFEYAPRSNGAKDYESFCQELLERIKGYE